MVEWIGVYWFLLPEVSMKEINRLRRNSIERRCLSKSMKRLFSGAPHGTFKMLEKVKRASR